MSAINHIGPGSGKGAAHVQGANSCPIQKGLTAFGVSAGSFSNLTQGTVEDRLSLGSALGTPPAGLEDTSGCDLIHGLGGSQFFKNHGLPLPLTPWHLKVPLLAVPDVQGQMTVSMGDQNVSAIPWTEAGKFTALQKPDGSLSLIKSKGLLFIVGSTLNKDGTPVVRTLPHWNGIENATSVRELKKFFSERTYEGFVTAHESEPSVLYKFSDQNLLKWHKRFERWENGSTFSKVFARVGRRLVGDSARLQSIVSSVKANYQKLYNDLEAQLTPKKAAAPVSQMEQKEVSAPVIKTRAIRLAGVLDQFRSLETRVIAYNRQLGGLCQDAVDVLAGAYTTLTGYSKEFDPTTVKTEAQFQSIQQTLDRCEKACLDSIKRATHKVTLDIVPLLVLDERMPAFIQQMSKEDRTRYVDQARMKIKGLSSMYRDVRSQLDALASPLAEQQLTLFKQDHALLSERPVFKALFLKLETTVKLLHKEGSTPAEKQASIRAVLHGEGGIESVLAALPKMLKDGVSKESLGQVEHLLETFKSHFRHHLQTPQHDAATTHALVGAGGKDHVTSLTFDPALLKGATVASDDPMLSSLSHLEVTFSTSLGMVNLYFEAQATLINLGNRHASSKSDSLLGEFQSIAKQLLNPSYLKKFDAAKWSDLTQRFSVLQDKVRSELLHLSLADRTQKGEPSEAFLILATFYDQLNQMFTDHVAYPEAIEAGKAPSDLTDLRASDASYHTVTMALLDQLRLVNTLAERKTGVLSGQSAFEKLRIKLEKVLLSQRSDEFAQLSEMIEFPSKELFKLFKTYPNFKGALDRFKAEAKPHLGGSYERRLQNVSDFLSNPVSDLSRTQADSQALFLGESSISGDASRRVEVYGMRLTLGGSVEVWINRDHRGDGEQDLKKVTFSPTGILDGGQTHRFETPVFKSQYKAIFSRLVSMAGQMTAQNGEPLYVLETPVEDPIPVASLENFLGPNFSLDGFSVGNSLSSASFQDPTFVDHLLRSDLSDILMEGAPLAGPFPMKILVPNSKQYYRLERNTASGPSNFTLTKYEKRLFWSDNRLESRSFNVMDSTTPTLATTEFVYRLLEDDVAMASYRDTLGAGFIDDCRAVWQGADPELYRVTIPFAQDILQAVAAQRAENQRLLTQHQPEMTRLRNDIMASLKEASAQLQAADLNDLPIDSPLLLSSEAFKSEISSRITGLEDPDTRFVKADFEKKVIAEAFHFYVTESKEVAKSLSDKMSGDITERVHAKYAEVFRETSVSSEAMVSGSLSIEDFRRIYNKVVARMLPVLDTSAAYKDTGNMLVKSQVEVDAKMIALNYVSTWTDMLSHADNLKLCTDLLESKSTEVDDLVFSSFDTVLNAKLKVSGPPYVLQSEADFLEVYSSISAMVRAGLGHVFSPPVQNAWMLKTIQEIGVEQESGILEQLMNKVKIK